MAKLRLAADLSRSAMWELETPHRRRADIPGERSWARSWEAHAGTFTVITSVPAEFVQHGTEPDLPTITKSLLFSIAHNALTNVVWYAEAKKVVIGLDCTDDRLRLSVSDDGIGLPPDHEARGHGFRNMAGRRREDERRPGGEVRRDRGRHHSDLRYSAPDSQRRGLNNYPHPDPGDASGTTTR